MCVVWVVVVLELQSSGLLQPRAARRVVGEEVVQGAQGLYWR